MFCGVRMLPSQTIGCIHSITLRVSAVSIARAANTTTIAATCCHNLKNGKNREPLKRKSILIIGFDNIFGKTSESVHCTILNKLCTCQRMRHRPSARPLYRFGRLAIFLTNIVKMPDKIHRTSFPSNHQYLLTIFFKFKFSTIHCTVNNPEFY